LGWAGCVWLGWLAGLAGWLAGWLADLLRPAQLNIICATSHAIFGHEFNTF